MAKTDKEPKSVGRPTIVVNPKQIETLASLWLTKEAAADFLGIGRTTLHSKLRDDPEISAAWARGRARTQITTMQGLISSAQQGNIRALMFLAERICGLSETVVHEGQVETRYVVELPAETPAQDWQAAFGSKPTDTKPTVN